MNGIEKKHMGMIFLFFLFVFLLIAEGHVESIDASLRFEMTKSIVDKGRFEVVHPLARKGVDGRYYNTYGPVTSFLAIPFYIISKGACSFARERS